MSPFGNKFTNVHVAFALTATVDGIRCKKERGSIVTNGKPIGSSIECNGPCGTGNGGGLVMDPVGGLKCKFTVICGPGITIPRPMQFPIPDGCVQVGPIDSDTPPVEGPKCQWVPSDPPFPQLITNPKICTGYVKCPVKLEPGDVGYTPNPPSQLVVCKQRDGANGKPFCSPDAQYCFNDPSVGIVPLAVPATVVSPEMSVPADTASGY